MPYRGGQAQKDLFNNKMHPPLKITQGLVL